MEVYKELQKSNDLFSEIECSVFCLDEKQDHNHILFLAKTHNDSNLAKNLSFADKITYSTQFFFTLKTRNQ